MPDAHESDRQPVIAQIDNATEMVVLPFSGRCDYVIHKGVQYTVAATAEPDVWQWQFQIGNSVRTGKTQTRLAALAARRVQLKIDAALKESKSPSEQRSDNSTDL